MWCQIDVIRVLHVTQWRRESRPGSRGADAKIGGRKKPSVREILARQLFCHLDRPQPQAYVDKNKDKDRISGEMKLCIGNNYISGIFLNHAPAPTAGLTKVLVFERVFINTLQ
ncbi:hypothetical protein G3M48_000981 [Beauveria asiatica]|uniref:Uncharacterized protein n=1 Tax=Beauveria asiatica TaxID=1069075 RepID=A0AAW0S0K9_9HYPO